MIRPCDWAQLTTLPARSSCVARMPVSTMPTLTPPVAGKAPRPAASQPSGASMSASAVPPVWPVLLRPYSSAKRGSFGVALTRMTLSTSAYSTTRCGSGAATSAAGSPSCARPGRRGRGSCRRCLRGAGSELRWAADAPGLNLTMTDRRRRRRAPRRRGPRTRPARRCATCEAWVLPAGFRWRACRRASRARLASHSPSELSSIPARAARGAGAGARARGRAARRRARACAARSRRRRSSAAAARRPPRSRR